MKPRESRHTRTPRKSLISLLSRGFAAFLIVLSASGCSPKSLFGGSDDSKATITNYQPVNRSCTNLDLSAPNLRGQELRSLLKCFNAYGALDPIQKLFDRLSDDQVNSLVELGNQYILNDPSFLYDLKQTYSDEKNTGALDQSMQSVSLLLQNPDLITSVFSLLDTAQNGNGQSQKALKILQAIGNHLNADSMTEGMSFGMNLTSSKAFASLQTELQSTSSDSASPDLETLTDGFYRILQDTESSGPRGKAPFSLMNNLNLLAQSGDLFTGADRLFGTSSAEIAANVPTLVPIFSTLAANNGELFDGLQELVQSLQSPLLCLNGTKQVPDPIMHLFSEISDTPDGGAGEYIRRTHLLTIVALTPFCKFQPELETNYQSLVKFASSPGMYGAEKIIKSFFTVRDANGSHPLSKLIENFLADPSNRQKAPIMEELSNRNAWADILLLASLPGSNDRANMISALSFVSDPAPELGGESIKDAITDLVLAGGSDKLFAVVNALKGYVNQNDPVVYPVLDGFRNAFYSNDVHPFLDFTRKILVNAPEHALFFNSLFSLSQYPEFKPAIELLSQIAKDGRLKAIYGDASVVFMGLAKPGRHQVNPDVALPFSPDRRHNLSAADLTENTAQTIASSQSGQSGQSTATSASDVCAVLTPEVSLDDLSNTKLFNRQWDRFLNCLAAKGDYRDVKADVDYLRNQKTDDGRSELVFGIDLLRDFSKSVSKPEINDLTNLWISGEDNGKMNRWLDQASAWVSHQVTQPLLNLIRPLLAQAMPDIQEIEHFAAKTLRQDNFPALLLEVDRLTQMKPNPESEVKPVDFDLARVNRWIENKECENTPNDHRATDIVRDYEYGVTSFEYVDGMQPKFSWNFDEVKALVEPMLQKFANPEQSNPEHTMTDAVIDFLTYFSLKKGQAPNSAQHFTPDVIANWFYDRANDKKLVTQYYLGDPPEAQPRVRYLDGLDRLEAVLVNADFDSLAPVLNKIGVKVGVNIGKMSLAEIGDSWGDEPYEIWPEEIKRKYAGKTPPTLRKTIEHVGEIMNWLKVGVGFPKLPQCSQKADPNDSPELQAEELSNNEPFCGWIPAVTPLSIPLPTCLNMPDVSEFDLRNIKRRLYNIAQVYDVMLDNLPDSGKPEQGGMKVLRDLFFQFNYSTPVEYRGQLQGARNNLSFITFLAQTGIDRQLAFELRKLNRNDPMLRNFFGALVSLARAPGAKHLIEQLLVNDSNHELIWNIAKSFYPLMGNAFSENGNPLAEPRQDALRMKQTLMYGIAALEKENLIDDTVVGLSSILDHDASIISSHTDWIAEKTADTDISWIARAYFADKESPGKTALNQIASQALEDSTLLENGLSLFQILKDNPEIKSDWDTFHSKLNSMDALSSFKLLNTSALNRDLLSFFEHRNTSLEDNQTEKALRSFAADHLDSGDVDRILELVAKDPTHFEKLLDTYSKYVKNGDLKNFFAYLRREMKPVN